MNIKPQNLIKILLIVILGSFSGLSRNFNFSVIGLFSLLSGGLLFLLFSVFLGHLVHFIVTKFDTKMDESTILDAIEKEPIIAPIEEDHQGTMALNYALFIAFVFLLFTSYYRFF